MNLKRVGRRTVALSVPPSVRSCACTAVAQLSPAADFCDIDGNLLITNDLFEGMVVRDGLMVLPEGAGLGLRKL